MKTVVIPTLASPDFTCKSQVPPTLHIALLTRYLTYRRVCPLDSVVRLDVLPGLYLDESKANIMDDSGSGALPSLP